MINELKSLVENSSEDEVKSLLFHILLHINMVEESKIPADEFTANLKKIYVDFLHYKSRQTAEKGL